MPEVVQNKARAVDAGAWLDELPALVAGLERDWSLTVGPSFGDLGVGRRREVSTGLLCTLVDLQPGGRDMLEAANVVAEQPAP